MIIKTKFFKTNSLKQREFWSFINILQIILAISFYFIYLFPFIFLYIYSFWRRCKYNFKVWKTLTQLYYNARNFLRHERNLNLKFCLKTYCLKIFDEKNTLPLSVVPIFHGRNFHQEVTFNRSLKMKFEVTFHFCR